MKSGKKYYEKTAKLLYKKSLQNGLIDEKKAKVILSGLTNMKPAGLSSILKSYKRLIVNKLASEQITVETNITSPLSKNMAADLKRKTGAQRIINKTNPQIIFGAKIYYGDWVWDDTLDGKLEQIVKGGTII